MSKRSWLRNWFPARKIGTIRKSPARSCLYIESLEERVTPAFTGFVNLDNGLQLSLIHI